jgi:hypothetical protein
LLGFKPKAGLALTSGTHPVVGDVRSGRGQHKGGFGTKAPCYNLGNMPYDGSYLEQNNCSYAPYRDLASVEIENSTRER